MQPAVGCYSSWANLQCSGCLPLGEKLLWNRSIVSRDIACRTVPMICQVTMSRQLIIQLTWYIDSWAPGRPGCHFNFAIFNLVLLIDFFFRSSNDNAPRWMPWYLTDDRSKLVQVMAWCRQVTSHYLSQCWPSSMSPFGVTRPQWVNSLPPGRFERNFRFIGNFPIKFSNS